MNTYMNICRDIHTKFKVKPKILFHNNSNYRFIIGVIMKKGYIQFTVVLEGSLDDPVSQKS